MILCKDFVITNKTFAWWWPITLLNGSLWCVQLWACWGLAFNQWSSCSKQEDIWRFSYWLQKKQPTFYCPKHLCNRCVNLMWNRASSTFTTCCRYSINSALEDVGNTMERQRKYQSFSQLDSMQWMKTLKEALITTRVSQKDTMLISYEKTKNPNTIALQE